MSGLQQCPESRVPVRHRQRKKAKVDGLKAQVEELTARLKALESSTKEVQQLERSNEAYEQQLWSQHAEVRAIQEQLQANTESQRGSGSQQTGDSRQQQLEQATHRWLRQVRLCTFFRACCGSNGPDCSCTASHDVEILPEEAQPLFWRRLVF